MGVTNDPSVLQPTGSGDSLLAKLRFGEDDPVLQRIEPKGMPLLYGDEEELARLRGAPPRGEEAAKKRKARRRQP